MRNIVNYGEKLNKDLILALGYFDSLHKGHEQVLQKTVKIATERSLTPAVLIFYGGKGGKDVFTLYERITKIFSLGIDNVIITELNANFMQKTATKFLTELTEFYSVKAVVSGSDFTFGKSASGSVLTLENFFGKENVITESLLSLNGSNKISTTDIKGELINGNVEKANELLGYNYYVSGKVVKGKMLGKSLGFPTANIVLSDDKLAIKQGVYLTFSIVDNILYPSITNFGTQPTVKGQSVVLETHLKGFNGDLYDKVLTVYFVKRIRDIVAFSSVDELKNQLKLDLEQIK